MTIRALSVAVTATASIAAASAVPTAREPGTRPLAARPAAGEAPTRDAESWRGLVQMPVAVARLEVAGVPDDELGLLVQALNVEEVSPTLFLETAWGIPVLWGDDANAYGGTAGEDGVGSYVQSMHERGLRGRRLAEAIHAELRRRGVPAGGQDGGGRHDALDPDYLPDDWVDGRFRDDPLFGADGSDLGERAGRGAPRIFRGGGHAGTPAGRTPAVRRGGGGGDGPRGPAAGRSADRGDEPARGRGADRARGRRGGGDGGGKGEGRPPGHGGVLEVEGGSP